MFLVRARRASIQHDTFPVATIRSRPSLPTAFLGPHFAALDKRSSLIVVVSNFLRGDWARSNTIASARVFNRPKSGGRNASRINPTALLSPKEQDSINCSNIFFFFIFFRKALALLKALTNCVIRNLTHSITKILSSAILIKLS